MKLSLSVLFRQSEMSDQQTSGSDQAVSDNTHKRSVSDDKPIASVSDARLKADLDASCITIIDTRKTFDDIKGKGNGWKRYDIFVNYATKLDESDVCYILPDMYRALCFLLGLEEGSVDYIKASTEHEEVNFPIVMYLLGYYEGTQPLGPFWKSSFPDNLDGVPQIASRVARILKYARALDRDLNTSSKERLKNWQESYIAGGYLQCVRARVCMCRVSWSSNLHLLLFDLDHMIFIRPTTVGHITVWLSSSVRLSLRPLTNCSPPE